MSKLQATTATLKKTAKEGVSSKKASQKDEGAETSLLELVEQEKALYQSVKGLAQEDLETLCSKIAVETSFALSEQIEELNVYGAAFRLGLHRVARWVITHLLKQKERCVVVPDALPGFTAMGFKRAPVELRGEVSAPALSWNTPEAQAAALIIDNFRVRSQQQIIVIETPDLLLLLFPVENLRDNLKKLGFYMTE